MGRYGDLISFKKLSGTGKRKKLREFHPTRLAPEAEHNEFKENLDHVNRTATSIHLASQKEGNTNFVHSTLDDILLGNASLP